MRVYLCSENVNFDAFVCVLLDAYIIGTLIIQCRSAPPNDRVGLLACWLARRGSSASRAVHSTVTVTAGYCLLLPACRF